jgi:hypothetical protein
LDLKVLREPLVLQVLKEHKVLKVLKVLKEHLDHKVQ